jgi:hypothetical protein
VLTFFTANTGVVKLPVVAIARDKTIHMNAKYDTFPFIVTNYMLILYKKWVEEFYK